MTACLVLYHVLYSRDLRFFRNALALQEHLDGAVRSAQPHANSTDMGPVKEHDRDFWEDSASLVLSSTTYSSAGDQTDHEKWTAWLHQECRRRLIWGLMVRRFVYDLVVPDARTANLLL
jgi:hypothetical protein